MKRETVDILVCPVCRGRLTLTVGEESDGRIQSGSLRCAACRVDYPIEAGIPHLLPPAQDQSSAE